MDARALCALYCQVLSVIAQQIMTLQGAVQRGEKRVIFEDVSFFSSVHIVHVGKWSSDLPIAKK